MCVRERDVNQKFREIQTICAKKKNFCLPAMHRILKTKIKYENIQMIAYKKTISKMIV